MRYLVLIAVCLLFWFPTSLLAEEPTPLTPEQVDKLIAQFDHASFEMREAASEALGAQATPGLAAKLIAAIADDRPEVNYRVIAVLGEMRYSEDEATRDASTAALRKLRDSDNRNVAEQALSMLFQRLLESIGEISDTANVFGGERKVECHPEGGGMAIAGRVIRIYGRTHLVQSGVNTGHQRVIVHQGVGRKIVLNANDDGIALYIREEVKGEEPIAVHYLAVDADDLRKHHPAAFAFYEAYEKYKGGTTINGMADNLPGVPFLAKAGKRAEGSAAEGAETEEADEADRGE